MNRGQNLTFLLYAGAVYFFGVALVHSMGLKIPGLYVYYNVPSYAYQDRIISFLAFGWGGFFLLAAKKRDKDIIRLIVYIGLVAVIALVLNTFITDFKQLDPGVSSSDFKWIIGALFFYWLALVMVSRQHVIRNK